MPLYDRGMSSDTLVVRRGEFAIDDPWATPPRSEAVSLRLATDGGAPRLATTVSAYFDDDQLTIVFRAEDDLVVSTHTRHDAPLYEEDAVEVFLAPAHIGEYFELEVSPNGTAFDARIESPDGVRATMRTDLDWNCAGLLVAVRKVFEADGTFSLETVVRVPFASLAVAAPRAGDAWRANFFRIDRHPTGDQFSAWQPTMKQPADFHVTSAFGKLRFE
jgi:hypothetical protein